MIRKIEDATSGDRYTAQAHRAYDVFKQGRIRWKDSDQRPEDLQEPDDLIKENNEYSKLHIGVNILVEPLQSGQLLQDDQSVHHRHRQPLQAEVRSSKSSTERMTP
jgi:hypothetical protein